MLNPATLLADCTIDKIRWPFVSCTNRKSSLSSLKKAKKTRGKVCRFFTKSISMATCKIWHLTPSVGTGTSILTPPFHYCHLLSELGTNNADFYSYFHLHSHTIQIRYHLLFSDHYFTPYNSMNAEDLCFNRDYPTLPSRAESPPWRIYRCETLRNKYFWHNFS